ncbi:MAG TPA: hypothetical protein VEA37_02630 [Flavobacterium sp.]|nr:hypothetical protein [Flavobacterium sp.]
MKVELKGGNIVITMPAEIKDPPPSKSGKTLTVAGTGGFVETESTVNGKKVWVNVNAFIHVKDKTNGKK